MKVRDLITKMSDDTEILIYSESVECAMPQWGDCKGGEEPEYDCRNCTDYVREVNEWAVYHGRAAECPIKIADRAIIEINNAKHRVQTSKRKWKDYYLIAIRVGESK